jgi:L-arabinonolactonase
LPNTIPTATVAIDCRCFLGEGIVWWAPRRALLWTDIERSTFWMHDAGGSRSWKLPKRLASFTPNRSGGLLFALEDALFRADRAGNFVFGTMNQAAGNAPIGSFYQWSTRAGLRRLDLPNIGIANSICFSPDGGTMYFCDTPQAKIMACDYDAESAAVSNVRAFTVFGPTQGHPDGAIVDADGYLWSAVWGGAVTRRYRPDGTIEREIAVPAKNVTCLAFGGEQLNELYITTARQDMSPADLERLPEIGGVFRAMPEGVRGLQDRLFAD